MDRGRHFVSQVITHVLEALGITQNLHVPYYPTSSGGTERSDKEVKTLLGKLSGDTANMAPGPTQALFYIRMRPRWNMGISPFELLFGHPPDTLKGLDPHSLSLERGDVVLSSYLTGLHERLQTLWRHSALTQTLPLEEALHPFKPGDRVWIK